MTKKQKLELTWVGKDKRAAVEPRILIEDPEKSYHARERRSENDIFDNILIHGDNLLALKALEQDYAGKVKCIYIDPPYNTGNAFEGYYDDGLEHSIWLGLIRDRIEALRNLLSDDGIIFVSIDDDEGAYLKVLMDEIFQRKNYCGAFVWEKKKKPSFLDANMGTVTESIFAYAKNRELSPAFIGGLTEQGKKYPINNAGNSVQIITFPAQSVVFNMNDQIIEPQDMSEGNIVTSLINPVEIVDGRNKDAFSLEGEWRYSQSKIDEVVCSGEQIRISKIPFRPNHIKPGGEPKKIKNLLSILGIGIATYEDATEESRVLFGVRNAFPYPKPEKLIQTLVAAVTKENDLVLDSFAGSGTTAAVVHKMKRRWIAVELENHAETHIVPRLRKVINGEDAGGVTDSTGWKGGGGFRYYRLAPSMLERDNYGNWIISRGYNPAMLAEAMCKHMGFTYAPSQNPDEYWKHGFSTETDFIFVTTQNLNHATLAVISGEVGPDCSLLICCKAVNANMRAFKNLTIKKIPQTVLEKCEWGHDDYSLNISNLPMAADDEDTLPSPAAETAGEED